MHVSVLCINVRIDVYVIWSEDSVSVKIRRFGLSEVVFPA